MQYTRVATLSLDASRRLMIAPLSPDVKTCSEPPPDATASILAESGLKAKANLKGGATAEADLADKFQTTLALIANRTAAVEFWRTTSFVYCQMRLNGWNDAARDYLTTAEKIAPQFGSAESPPGVTTRNE
jgi:hypothetical protein